MVSVDGEHGDNDIAQPPPMTATETRRIAELTVASVHSYVPMTNSGNWCFMNSTMQFMCSSSRLRTVLLSHLSLHHDTGVSTHFLSTRGARILIH